MSQTTGLQIVFNLKSAENYLLNNIPIDTTIPQLAAIIEAKTGKYPYAFYLYGKKLGHLHLCDYGFVANDFKTLDVFCH